MVELKSIKMNRSKIQKRANRIVWNVYFRRTLLMGMAGISLLGIANLTNFITNM